jgi:hypothetical protein
MGQEMHTVFLLGNLQGRDCLEVIGAAGKIILIRMDIVEIG